MVTRSWRVNLSLALVVLALSAPVVRAQDASAYRAFRLGSTLEVTAKAAGLAPEAAKLLYEHPLRIQELQWNPRQVTPNGTAPQPDSVSGILFDFGNGLLYRIVVTYDGEKTEGMTDQDLIDVLSAAYGPAHRSPGRIITSAAGQTYSDTEAVIARWEDAAASVNLFRGQYRSDFGLVIFSKALAPKARAAIDAAILAAQLDAPRRDLAEQQMQAETARLTHLKARAKNKIAFRF